MKTIATFALLIISTILPCLAQQPAKQQEKRRPGVLGLRGPVRSVRDEQVAITNVNGEPVEGARVLVLTITYNEDGTKQEQTFYAPDGAIRTKRASLYDQDGRLLEDTNFTGRNHELSIRTVYHYDDQKKESEFIMYKPDGSILMRRTVVQQNNPQRAESTVYDENGAVVSHSTTNKSPQGRSFETFTYGSSGANTESVTAPTSNGGQTYERRENGKIVYRHETIPGEKGSSERIIYNMDGTVQKREHYTTEFDSHGNPVKMSRSVAEGDSTDYKLVEVNYWTIEYYE